MKEIRFFYVPNAGEVNELPEEEVVHAVRVLRMVEGDEMVLTDGKGIFYTAVVTETNKRHCYYKILEVLPQEKGWANHVHIAMAPTKNIDRTEWFVEKATEIGFDEMTFLNCRFSERKNINMDRVEKIVVSAMKQSRKSEMPMLNGMVRFEDFVKRQFSGDKFICHCYEGEKKLLKEALVPGEDALILIGPEGDFSEEEVAKAIEAGFQPVSLGKSRLRTETAALVASHTFNLLNQK